MFSRSLKPALLSAVILTVLIPLLSGCTYTAPYRTVSPTTGLTAGGTARVTFTFAEIRPGKRWAFFRQTREVIQNLPSQDGLLGYSFRFEIVGRKAWTMTAWRDTAAQKRFLKSDSHQRATRAGEELTTDMRFQTVEVPVTSLPLDWKSALTYLESAPRYPPIPSPAATNAVPPAPPSG